MRMTIIPQTINVSKYLHTKTQSQQNYLDRALYKSVKKTYCKTQKL